jgi:hypothetical protein
MKMENFEIWETLSYSWTEIGLEDDEYKRRIQVIKEKYPEWSYVKRIINKDVCGSFALDSFLVFPCMLWMLMPDWGYDDKEIKDRMRKWYSKPFGVHMLNPFRLVGYPVARAFSASAKRRIYRAYKNT